MTSTCNNALRLLPHSPQPRLTMTPTTAHSATPSRHLTSPLKQRTPKYNTSPHKATRLSSPQKLPKKILFQSSEPVSFTPQRTKQPPRAWERRPATPFVPRDEKQKIWKRVPLGELGIDINQPVGVSRREQAKSKDYTRVVKKLKTGHGGVDIDDKENQVIGAKTVNEKVVLKRPYLPGGDFVSMKMEEDEILGSPKKKFRPIFQDNSSEESTRLLIEIDVSVNEFDEDVEDNKDETNATTPEACSPQMSITAASKNTKEAQPDQYPNCVNNSNATVRAMNLKQDAHPNAHKDQEPEVDRSTTHETGGIILEDNCDHRGAMVSTHANERTEHISHLDSNDRLVTHQEIDKVEEPQSSSPPTILAENVIVDELEVAELLSKQPSTGAEDSFEVDNNVEQEPQDYPANKPTSKRISDGETAFLQDFLLRTKAQRIAREHEINQTIPMDQGLTQSESEQVEKHDDQSSDEPTEESAAPSSLDIILSDPIYGMTSSLSDPATETSSSPLRRSKRANVTTLPRPSTLPNPIQLKRASGTEFIFTANKASSSANVALVTRTNTKQNKGSALNVRARLEQLTTGKDNIENPVADKEDFENVEMDRAATKRKRSKNDNGRKVRKALRWNDENLVLYQEFQNNEAWEEDISDSSQESVNPTPREDVSSTSSTRIKLTMTLPSSGTTTKTKNRDTSQESDKSSSIPGASQPEHKDWNNANSSQSRVRRVRRGIAGSVNGTPGPKTRSKKPILESDLIDTTDVGSGEVKLDETLQESAAATVALSSLADQTAKNNTSAAAPATRRSRIAVSSTRHGHGTVVAGNAARSMRNSTSSENARVGEEKDGDLLGKRRLRIRD